MQESQIIITTDMSLEQDQQLEQNGGNINTIPISNTQRRTKFMIIIVSVLVLVLLACFWTYFQIRKIQQSKPTQNATKSPQVQIKSKWPQNISNIQAFKKIYESNLWDPSGKYPSGAGSVPQKNVEYLNKVQQLIDHPQIKRIVEVGFGDYHLSSLLKIPADKLYIGYDVVESLLQKNETNRKFKLMKDIYDFNQEGDLLIEKDAIQHWPNKEVEYFLNKVVPRFRYAFLTNDENGNGQPRQDINYGQWSPLSMKNYGPKEFVYRDKFFPQKVGYVIPKWPL